LEWVLKYYVKGEDEGWKYEKGYGVLIKDMVKVSIKKSEKKEIGEKEQLEYVIPLKEIEKIKDEEYKLKNTYHRYIWEGSVNI
jgi:hypothetical protein